MNIKANGAWKIAKKRLWTIPLLSVLVCWQLQATPAVFPPGNARACWSRNRVLSLPPIRTCTTRAVTRNYFFFPSTFTDSELTKPGTAFGGTALGLTAVASVLAGSRNEDYVCIRSSPSRRSKTGHCFTGCTRNVNRRSESCLCGNLYCSSATFHHLQSYVKPDDDTVWSCRPSRCCG